MLRVARHSLDFSASTPFVVYKFLRTLEGARRMAQPRSCLPPHGPSPASRPIKPWGAVATGF